MQILLITLALLFGAFAAAADCTSVHDAAWRSGQTQTQRDYSNNNLSCSSFNGVTFFIKTRFDGMQFSNGAMKNSTCVFCTFRGARMAGANVSGSTFDGAVMAGADFSAGADELEADLSAARLVSVDFSAANLSGANLSKADLSSANLKNARFNGANLSGARLRSTLNSESADFSGAVYDELTEFPADWSCARLAERGLKYQASGNADAVRTCDQIVDDDSEALRVAIARRTAAINQLRNPAARN